MIWYWTAGILSALAIGLIVWSYVRERRYLRKKTSEAMKPELWQEIDEERQGSLKRKKDFQKALEEAGKK